MKKVKILAAGMVVAGLLAGCGNMGNAPVDGGDRAGIPRESSAELTEGSSAVLAESRTEISGAEDSSEDTAATAEIELQEEERAFFTDFIQEKENYGFLLSEYDIPGDVNLFEVLYSGAGFGEGIPEEDIPLYLEKTQEEEIYTDCVKMSRQDIDDFLKRKLGLGLDEMNHSLDVVYLKETDAYYIQAGDTNYLPFMCTGGTVQGDTYTLHFAPAADWAETAGERETVLVKTDDGYRFISNHILAQ